MVAAATIFEDWILRAGALAVALAAIAGVVIGATRFIMRRFAESVRDIVEDELAPIKARTEQLLPNGGSSLADSIRRVEARQLEERAEQRAIREALEVHLSEHRTIRPGDK